jgi:hypothetical protein
VGEENGKRGPDIFTPVDMIATLQGQVFQLWKLKVLKKENRRGMVAIDVQGSHGPVSNCAIVVWERPRGLGIAYEVHPTQRIRSSVQPPHQQRNIIRFQFVDLIPAELCVLWFGFPERQGINRCSSDLVPEIRVRVSDAKSSIANRERCEIFESAREFGEDGECDTHVQDQRINSARLSKDTFQNFGVGDEVVRAKATSSDDDVE